MSKVLNVLFLLLLLTSAACYSEQEVAHEREMAYQSGHNSGMLAGGIGGAVVGLAVGFIVGQAMERKKSKPQP